jgi:hypothetical protein
MNTSNSLRSNSAPPVWEGGSQTGQNGRVSEVVMVKPEKGDMVLGPACSNVPKTYPSNFLL